MSKARLSRSAARRLLIADLLDRPQLLLRELLWRWLCGGVLLGLAAFAGDRIWDASLPALRVTGIFNLSVSSALQNPSALPDTLAACVAILKPQVQQALLGIAPLGVFCWLVASALGRSAVLALFDARLPRRPWMLLRIQMFQTAGDLTIGCAWYYATGAAGALLHGEQPHLAGYACTLLLISGLAGFAWLQLATKIQVALALALLEDRSAAHAFFRAWQLPDARLAHRTVRFRQAARRTQLYVLWPVLLISLLPSPFHALWAVVAWYAVLSLLPLAATDAVRLGVFFALMREVQEEHYARAAAVPGLLPDEVKL